MFLGNSALAMFHPCGCAKVIFLEQNTRKLISRKTSPDKKNCLSQSEIANPNYFRTICFDYLSYFHTIFVIIYILCIIISELRYRCFLGLCWDKDQIKKKKLSDFSKKNFLPMIGKLLFNTLSKKVDWS
jgi:hypothetical protein